MGNSATGDEQIDKHNYYFQLKKAEAEEMKENRLEKAKKKL